MKSSLSCQRRAGSLAWLAAGIGPCVCFAPEQEGASDGGGQAVLSADSSVDKNTSIDAENASIDDGHSILTRSTNPSGDEEATDEKGAEGKGEAGESRVSETVPEHYEVELPEGVELDAGALDHYTPAFKELGLSNRQVQQLTDLRIREHQAQAQNWVDTRKEWVETGRKDAEIGGTRYDAAIQTAQAAVTQFGDRELFEFLEASGMGDHPAVTRAFYRIGAAMGDDRLVASRGGSGVDSQAARLNRLYPTMNKG